MMPSRSAATIACPRGQNGLSDCIRHVHDSTRDQIFTLGRNRKRLIAKTQKLAVAAYRGEGATEARVRLFGRSSRIRMVERPMRQQRVIARSASARCHEQEPGIL